MAGEISIYGAGMSGMVAAINLARQGNRVRVYEAEEDYGGSSIYNPSTHATPIHPGKTSDYLGIDITPAFHKLRECPAYFHETMIHFPVYEVYLVERGNRSSGLDTLLFEQCQELGVDFEFSSPLRREDVPGLKPGSIIACGLEPAAYDMVGVPYLPWHGWLARGETEITDHAWLWFDESITEYGYLSSVNNLYFDLLFSFGKEVPRSALDRYEAWMEKTRGIRHDDWEYVGGAVPLARADNYKLFRNGLIMCGTMTGAMDPMMGFGISGALITGKIAAMAVSDPAQAQHEFDRFLYRFRQIFYMKQVWRRFLRPHVNLLERGIRLVGPKRVDWVTKQTQVDRLLIPLPFSIPGFGHANTYKRPKKR